jgi:hypothetical protein
MDRKAEEASEVPCKSAVIQTTINFYCGLETTQANEAFGKIIRDHIKFMEDA